MSGLGFAIAGTRLAGGLELAKRWWKLAAGLILGALLCWPLAHCSGERAGRAALQAEQARAAVEGINRADEQDQAIREAARTRADAVEGAIRNAVTNQPEEAARPVGPASSAALDELRRRQGR